MHLLVMVINEEEKMITVLNQAYSDLNESMKQALKVSRMTIGSIWRDFSSVLGEGLFLLASAKKTIH